jgi:hypothetical protein
MGLRRSSDSTAATPKVIPWIATSAPSIAAPEAAKAEIAKDANKRFAVMSSTSISEPEIANQIHIAIYRV